MTDKEKKEHREWLNNLPHEQLVTFCIIDECARHKLEQKLKLLTGCPAFGDLDPMDGSCVDCFYDNKELFERCEDFSRDNFPFEKKEQSVL